MKSILTVIFCLFTSVLAHAGTVSGMFNGKYRTVKVDRVDILKGTSSYSLQVGTKMNTAEGLVFWIDEDFSYSDASAMASDLLSNSNIGCGHYKLDFEKMTGSFSCEFHMIGASAAASR